MAQLFLRQLCCKWCKDLHTSQVSHQASLSQFLKHEMTRNIFYSLFWTGCSSIHPRVTPPSIKLLVHICVPGWKGLKCRLLDQELRTLNTRLPGLLSSSNLITSNVSFLKKGFKWCLTKKTTYLCRWGCQWVVCQFQYWQTCNQTISRRNHWHFVVRKI